MSADYKIYIDASVPATLNNGTGISTDCLTLQEAVLAWQRLAPEQKIRATVRVIGGRANTAQEIAFTAMPAWAALREVAVAGRFEECTRAA
jgi:hypothetical protein